MKWIITVTSFLFVFSGCQNNTDKKIFNIGTNIWPGYEALHLAQDTKLFKENIQVEAYDSATLVLNKFRKKELDAAALTLDEMILLRDQGYNPVIIAVLDISEGADVLIAQKGIESIRDLKNKSIGVENTALGSYILARVLEKTLLTYEDIILVPLVSNRHEEAFTEGVVDAIITFEPVRSKLVKLGGKIIFSSKDIPGEIVDVLVVQKEMLNDKYINDILQGWAKAASQINNRDKNAIERISKRLEQTDKEFIASLEGLKIPSLKESNTMIREGILENTINNVQDIMFEKKLIKSKIDAKTLLY